MSGEATNGTPDPAQAAAGATQQQSQSNQAADEVKALHARIGDLTDRLGKSDATEKARVEKEQLARGEHEKVIGELKAKNETYQRDQEALLGELEDQWDEIDKTIPTDDERFKGIFKKPGNGERLTIGDLRYNLAEYRKLKRLGVLETKAEETKAAPLARSQAVQQQTSQQSPPVHGPQACWQ